MHVDTSCENCHGVGCDWCMTASDWDMFYPKQKEGG